MLTLEKLKQMEPWIFQKWTFIDFPEWINIEITWREIGYVAVRGSYHDRCVYCQNPYEEWVWCFEEIKRRWNKIFPENARKLVECDQEAFDLYRS